MTMKKFLKENWFKLSILTLAILYMVLFGYSQYLATKAHTLEVVNQLIHCGETRFDDQCANRAQSTLIFKGVFWPNLGSPTTQ